MHCADRYVYVLSPLQLYNTYTCKYTASQKMSYHCTMPGNLKRFASIFPCPHSKHLHNYYNPNGKEFACILRESSQAPFRWLQTFLTANSKSVAAN